MPTPLPLSASGATPEITTAASSAGTEHCERVAVPVRDHGIVRSGAKRAED